MSICSYMLDSISSNFEEEEQLRNYINKVIYDDIKDLNRNNYVLEVSPMLYEIMQRNLVHDIRYVERYMGILVSINENLASNQIRIRYERNDNMGVSFGNIGYGKTWALYKEEEKKLPDKVLFNKKKNATTLVFNNEAIVVKKSKDDKEDYEKAFLWAYFLYKSGMSKTKANKYIKEIMEDKKNEIK